MLTNARCLSEGVDVPSLDAVIFVSAKNSQVDVVQSVGRVMRPFPALRVKNHFPTDNRLKPFRFIIPLLPPSLFCFADTLPLSISIQLLPVSYTHLLMSEPVSDIIVYRTIILYGSLFQYIKALHGCNI